MEALAKSHYPHQQLFQIAGNKTLKKGWWKDKSKWVGPKDKTQKKVPAIQKTRGAKILEQGLIN